jgi:disulfide bond formation protein DsbB
MKLSLYFAWIIALVATFASLYFGEVSGMDPCRLCWYQRVCMIPLSYFLAVALYRNNIGLALTTLPLVFLGMLIAFYQVLSQQIPEIVLLSICGENHCTLPGPMPTLSALAFALIAILIIVSKKSAKS